MQARTLALIIAAALAAGCVGNETKPDQSAPEKASATPAPAPAAAPAKPECPPPPPPAKKTTKKTTKKEAAASEPKPLAPPDCEPAKPKTAAAPAATASTPPAKEAAPAAAAAAATTVGAADSAIGKNCNPCVVKSRDGTFDGEVYGNIPAGSKWARLRIGMEQPEVERLLGVSHQVHAYPTAKAWIPFYYGTDRYRYEVSYPGQGSVSYTGGSWGGGQGVVMMINYDPKR